MAEGRGIEPLCAVRRSLGLASQRITALPAFRVVGQVGLEPTKSPRSERGAFANLTTARWCRRADSNRHYAASQTADSTNWPTSARMVGPLGFEPRNCLVLSEKLCHLATGPIWRKRRGSNSHPVRATVFKTVDATIRPRFRTRLNLYERECATTVASGDCVAKRRGREVVRRASLK
jgi:hypothetical protein